MYLIKDNDLNIHLALLVDKPNKEYLNFWSNAGFLDVEVLEVSDY